MDLALTEIEGGLAAPVTREIVNVDYKGQSLEGIALEMQHRVAYNSINFPVDSVDGKKFNTLQFKVHFDPASGDPNSFDIWIINDAGDWAATSFMKHAKDVGGGWYQFSWDMVKSTLLL